MTEVVTGKLNVRQSHLPTRKQAVAVFGVVVWLCFGVVVKYANIKKQEKFSCKFITNWKRYSYQTGER